MDIKNVIEIEKESLKNQNGEMTAKIIIEKDNSLAIFCLIWENDKQKEGLRKKMMEMINKAGITRYWFSSTAWVSVQDKEKNDLYRRPSRDVNRKEALIIVEFNKEKGNQVFFQFYKKKNNVVEFEKEESLEKGSFDSYWNAWEDEAVQDEKMNNFIDTQNENFIKNAIKEEMEKYRDEINKCENFEDFQKIIMKAVKDLDEKIAEQKSKLLEDINETEEE